MPIPRDFAASLEPVEFVGESISMAPLLSIAETDLLCRRWRFGATTTERGTLDAAPGPGVAFKGAAAMGITPLPPLTPVVPPPEEPAEP